MKYYTISLVLLGLLLPAIIMAVIMGSVPAEGNGGPLFCVYFYVWYGGGPHWQHVIDSPLPGFYDSSDPRVLGWQLQLIKNAGFDCLIVSWWGPDDVTDRNAMILFRALQDYGLKAVIMVEPYLGGDPELYDRDWWFEVISYINRSYIDRYPDVYLRLYGKPLILAFNPIGMIYNPSGDFPDYTIRIVGNDIDNAKYQDWDYWPDYDRKLSGQLRIRRDGYVALAPRYDDDHFRPEIVPPYDPDLTRGWYGRQWQYVLEHQDEVRIVAIATWNEYHERTAIEPHLDPSASIGGPYMLYEKTRICIYILKSGAGQAISPLWNTLDPSLLGQVPGARGVECPCGG